MIRALVHVLVVWSLAATVGASAASAQEPEPGSIEDAEARALFNAGSMAFSRGQYDVALERFREAYDLSGRPELLFNVGTAADRLRRDDDAIAAFEQYLAERPDAPNRREVEARIAAIRAASDTTSQTDSSVDEGGGPGAGPWILVGSGGAVAVAATVLLVIALAERADLEGLTVEDDTTYAQVADQEDRVGLFSALGFAGIGLGLVAAGAGIAWAVSAGGDTTVTVGPGSITMQGSF